jgi:ATP-dependent Lhr-like helicase
MKGGAAATAFCSSTLEMGVDIGSVRAVGQVGPPWSVASLKQRLGRSGRKEGEPQVMRVYVQCRQGGPDADLFDHLNLDLLQAVAVTELMLEGWVEPPEPPRFDLSTLSQQVISVVAETGGCRADALFDRLCGRGAFREVDARLFTDLLRQLAREDVIEQMDGGDLILGLQGERLRRDKGFYAVFPTPDEYTVLHAGEVLGTLESAHQPGDHLLFAGRRWRVVDVDDERLLLHVEPAKGWKRPRFGGGVGDVHARVRQKMRDVLAAPSAMPYLDAEPTRCSMTRAGPPSPRA